MVSPIAAAQQAALASGLRVRGQAVLYVRGNTTLQIDCATRGSTRWDIERIDNGVHAKERSVDWIITLADMTTAAGTVLEPQRGDEIIDENDVVYRVMPFGPDEQLWRWHDRDSRSFYRIFTKERT